VRYIIQYYLDEFLFSIGDGQPVDIYQMPSGGKGPRAGEQERFKIERRRIRVGRSVIHLTVGTLCRSVSLRKET
jgi:hypothetical protein